MDAITKLVLYSANILCLKVQFKAQTGIFYLKKGFIKTSYCDISIKIL